MSKRAAIYLRVSTDGQTTDNQRLELDRTAKAAGWDVVMTWSVDRLGRSLQGLVTFLGELQAVGVVLYMHQQGVDTTTPAGTAMFQMMGVFAEFERSMIQEHVKAGLCNCAAGERLKSYYSNEEKGLTLRRYWTNTCQTCAIKDKCTTGKQRRITRWEHEHLLEDVQRRLDENPQAMR